MVPSRPPTLQHTRPVTRELLPHEYATLSVIPVTFYEQLVANFSFSLNASNTNALAQGPFTMTQDRALISFTPKLLRFQNPTGSVVAKLWQDSAGSPGVALATSNSVNLSTISSVAAEYVQFDFTDVTLQNGVTYWIGIEATYTFVNSVNHLKPSASNANPIAGSNVKLMSVGAWSNQATYDMTGTITTS